MFFSSDRVKREFENIYIDTIEKITDCYEHSTIETSFGDVNIIDIQESGNLPSIIVVHGIKGAGPLFLKNLMPLKDKCRIVIVDSLDFLDLRYSDALDGENYEHGQWIFEIMARLGLSDVILMGISVGGISVLNTLAFDARKIKAAILCSPAGLTTKNGSVLFNWQLRKYMGFNTSLVWNKELKDLAQKLISDPSDFTYEYIERIFNRFEFRLPKLKQMDQYFASKITAPVYVLAAEHDRLFSAKHLIASAKSLLPNLKGSSILKGENHFMGHDQFSKEVNLIIDNLI